MKNWKIIFIIVIVSAIGFGLRPLNKAVESLELRNAELLIDKNKKINELKEFTVKGDDGKVVTVNPDIDIPEKLSQTALLIDLQKIASAAGVEIPESWSFSVVDDSDLEVSKIGVSFSIKGNRGGIYKFIQLAEKNERLLVVNGLGVRTFYENSILTSEMGINLHAFSQEKINE